MQRDHRRSANFHRLDDKAQRAELARIRRNANSAAALEEDLFELASRYLVLFITLKYQPEKPEPIDLPTIQRHRNQFFKRMGSHPLLRKMKAVVWKLEEGPRAGLHMHCMMFYDGSSRQGVSIAMAIGEYWQHSITKGLGWYHNSNADVADFKRRGLPIAVGQVNRKDTAMREALRDFMGRYLAKATQVPREREPHDRMFGIRRFNRQR